MSEENQAKPPNQPQDATLVTLEQLREERRSGMNKGEMPVAKTYAWYLEGVELQTLTSHDSEFWKRLGQLELVRRGL